MRYLTHILLVTILPASLLFSSCGKDDNNNPPADPAFSGEFISVVHTTSGVASIDQEEKTLTFTNFKTDSGPDMNIYLATSNVSVTSNFIDLGDIKGVDGSYTYSLPDNIDYTEYKYVIVWCVAFNVNFGYALLVEQ